MQQVAPAGPVNQAGTLSGNPVSVAAGLATLRVLENTPDAYDRLEGLGAAAEKALEAALAATGVPGCVNRVGSMLTLFLGVGRVEGFSDACKSDQALFAHYFRGMLERGFYLPPSQFEAMFLSLAHTEADVDALGKAARSALGS
jgi:glutamate-1-semialdehyde 2,1-aminomutase